jgi:hypothetical protein
VESMEREGLDDRGRRRDDSGVEDLGQDDQEFSSVEDTGPEPSENPAVDDV